MTRVVALREVVERSTGTQNPASAPLEYFTYVDVAAVDNREKIIVGARAVVGSEAPSRAKKLIKRGDILVSTVRPNLNAVALVPSWLDGQVASTGFCVLRATKLAIPEYLYFYVRSRRFVDGLVNLVAGAMYPAVSDSQVLDQRLPLPSLEKQQQVVDHLSRADGILRLRREAQKKAVAVIPALFLDMFGDPATNPKGWPVQSFGAVGSLDRGRSRHRPRDAAELYGGPYPFIQTGDVANSGGRITAYGATYSEAGLLQSKLWPPGTLCITIAANIAKTGVLDFEACFPDSVVGFLPGREVTTAFVQGWLSFLQPTLEANAPQAAQKNINLEILRNLPIPLPPLSLQVVYEQRCTALASVRAQQDAALSKAEALFQSLLAGELTGAEHVASATRELLALEGVT